MQKLLKGSTVIAGAAAILMSPAAMADYPERPITMVVPWAAGGGTDATARIVASLLEEELGQPVNVTNQTGGSGAVGHSAIADAEPDGYTIGVATVEITMMHWQGLTEVTYEDLTPIAQYNIDPAGVQVAADAEWETLEELVEEIAANPGELQASGTGQGGIWHIAIAGMLDALDLDPQAVLWVPSEGAAPGLQDLLAGGVQIVPSSVVEAASMLREGTVRSLAVMSDERLDAFPDVPTLEEEMGIEWSIGAWRGVVGPAGLPDDVTERLIEAMDVVYESDEFHELMGEQGFGVQFVAGDDFASFMADSDETFGELMEALGLTE